MATSLNASAHLRHTPPGISPIAVPYSRPPRNECPCAANPSKEPSTCFSHCRSPKPHVCRPGGMCAKPSSQRPCCSHEAATRTAAFDHSTIDTPQPRAVRVGPPRAFGWRWQTCAHSQGDPPLRKNGAATDQGAVAPGIGQFRSLNQPFNGTAIYACATVRLNGPRTTQNLYLAHEAAKVAVKNPCWRQGMPPAVWSLIATQIKPAIHTPAAGYHGQVGTSAATPGSHQSALAFRHYTFAQHHALATLN